MIELCCECLSVRCMHHTNKYSELSSIIRLVRLSGWVFVSELSGCGFESRCSHINTHSVWRKQKDSDRWMESYFKSGCLSKTGSLILQRTLKQIRMNLLMISDPHSDLKDQMKSFPTDTYLYNLMRDWISSLALTRI